MPLCSLFTVKVFPWEVPLLICTTADNKKPNCLYDFITVSQFNISEKLADKEVQISTLVKDRTKKLQKALLKNGDKIKPIEKYVIRVFVEDYIDA